MDQLAHITFRFILMVQVNLIHHPEISYLTKEVNAFYETAMQVYGNANYDINRESLARSFIRPYLANLLEYARQQMDTIPEEQRNNNWQTINRVLTRITVHFNRELPSQTEDRFLNRYPPDCGKLSEYMDMCENLLRSLEDELVKLQEQQCQQTPLRPAVENIHNMLIKLSDFVTATQKNLVANLQIDNECPECRGDEEDHTSLEEVPSL
jgi:RecG-like helicase